MSAAGMGDLISREVAYLQRRVLRLERELSAARDEVARLRGPVFLDPAEGRRRERMALRERLAELDRLEAER